jgi:SAM-dependent methyltransferase
MTSTEMGWRGHPPSVALSDNTPELTEKEKYEKMWAIEDYRAVSPGEQLAQLFLSQAKPLPDSTVIDFGCGTGRGGLMIALFGKAIVTMLDFAENALDEDVKNATITQPHRISFLQHDLNEPAPVIASYGYCTDVMEHIPPEEVDVVLQNILNAASHVFFNISTVPDVMGERIGEPLHLTVESYEWWAKKLQKHGAVVHWSHDMDGKACCFYVSSWAHATAKDNDIEYDGEINNELDKILENIKTNIQGPWQLLVPHEVQNTEIMLIAGGPSLNDYADEIIKLRNQGMPMVTTNGTYNWAIANGLKPSMQMIIDSRAFNKRFLQPILPECKYFLASQCDPVLFEDMPPEQTWIWHPLNPQGEDRLAAKILDEYYDFWLSSPGGSTVTLRGLCLLRQLGFHKIHVYGFDSCYRADEHHAYSQPENDYNNPKTLPVSVGGKVFMCDPWMFCQAEEFMKMVSIFGDEIDLDIKGDGLIAHIIKTGAELERLDEEEEK